MCVCVCVCVWGGGGKEILNSGWIRNSFDQYEIACFRDLEF